MLYYIINYYLKQIRRRLGRRFWRFLTPFSKADLPKNPLKPAANSLSAKAVWIAYIGLA